MISIAFIGEPLLIEEAQEKLNSSVSKEDFISSMDGDYK